MTHSNEVKYICAKEYLEDVRAVIRKIQALQEYIDIQSSILMPRGISYGDKIKVCGMHDKLERNVIKFNELMAHYFDELELCLDTQREAVQIVNNLTRTEYQQALTMHYFNNQPWAYVCDVMGYTHDGMMSLVRRAIIELYDYIPEEYRRYTIPAAI